MKQAEFGLLVLATSFTLCVMARATDAGAELPEHQLPPVIVRYDPTPLTVPTRESVALESTRSTLYAEDLALLKPSTASDALKVMPGVHTETRGRKYKQFHSFRGQVYPYPDLLLDGLWQRDAKEVLYVYPGAALERVEVMRSSSTLFSGLSDVVGVINLVPRRPVPATDGPRPLQLGFEAGSYGALRAHAIQEVGIRADSALTIGAQHYQIDGRSDRNAAESLSSVFGAWHTVPAPGHRIELSGWWLYGERELEMPDPDGPASRNLKNRRERYDPIQYGHLSLRGYHAVTDDATTSWSLFFTDRRARYANRKIDPEGPGPADSDADEDDREYGAQMIQGFALAPENTLRLGLFMHRWTAPEGKQSYVGSRQDVSSFAVVLADEHRIGSWTFDAGVRYARSYLHDFSGPAFDVTGQSTQTRAVRDEWEDPVLTATAGAAFALDARNRLYAHGGVGERRPGPGAVNPDGSRPDTESRYTADLGWTLDWGRNADGRLNVVGFGVWRQDAITRINQTGIDDAGNEFYFSGNQNIRQRGIEVEGHTPAIWQNRLALFGGATLMQSATKKTGSGYDTFREIPTRIITAGIRAKTGPLDGVMVLKHVDAYENFRFAQDRKIHPLGDYWDLSLTTGLRFGRDHTLRLYGGVDNLLDDNYATVVGWTDPGRRYRVGLEAAF